MTAVNQQREIEFGVYKQNVKRRELMEEESSGLFASYTDPSRNISVGNTKSELSGVLKRQMALLEGKLISCHRDWQAYTVQCHQTGSLNKIHIFFFILKHKINRS